MHRRLIQRLHTTAPRNQQTVRWIISVATLASVLMAWAVVAAVIDDNIVPRPLEVFARVIDIVASGEAASNFATTLAKIGAGFALAVAAGLPLGFLMGRSAFMNSYLSLPMFVLGNVPGLTYAVFALVIFGVGPGGPIVVSALVAVPFIAINVAEGVRSVDGDLLRMCEAFERSPRDVLRHVYLPAVSAFVLVGVRYGFAMAWKVEALTEVFGAQNGVGFMIRKAYQEFQVDDMLAWTMLFVIVMILIERGLGAPRAPFVRVEKGTGMTLIALGRRRSRLLAAARQVATELGGRVDGIGADHAGGLAARRRLRSPRPSMADTFARLGSERRRRRAVDQPRREHEPIPARSGGGTAGRRGTRRRDGAVADRGLRASPT